MTIRRNMLGSFASGDCERQLALVLLALDNLLDAVIIHDKQGRIVYFNNAAAEEMGLTVEEFAALPPWGFSGVTATDRRDEIRDTLERDGEVVFLSEPKTRNRGHKVVEVHARQVQTEQGPLIISLFSDVTQRLKTEEILKRLAFHDPLTGLANRALFDDRLEQAIAGAKRHDRIVGLAYIDIDAFKDVNDVYGHDAGDQVLISLGERLEHAVRDEDTVARLGGDEFVVIFPQLKSREDLTSIVAKLNAHLAEPLTIDGGTISLSASAGLALFDPDHDDARSIVMRADIDMYNAKRAKAEAGPVG